MKKYNYFDDDEPNGDIQSLINSFDAPKEVKKEEVDRSLKIIQDDRTEKKALEKEAEKKAEKEAVIEAIKAFSKKSGEKIASVAHAVRDGSVAQEFEKLSKRKKVRVTLVLVLVFFIFFAMMVGLTLHSVSKENKRIAKFDSDAGKVCSQCITKYGSCGYENLYSAYGITGYRMNGLCYAREMDFNNDNISELLICYDDGGVYYTEVWGYNNDNDFVNFYREKATQTKKKKDDAWITLYTRNNKYYIGTHSGKKQEKVDLYGLRSESFEKKYSAEYDSATQSFTINKKVDSVSFERVKLAVLVEEKAAVNAEKVTKTVESLIGTTGTAQLLSSTQNIQNAYYEVIEGYNQTYGKAKVVKKNNISYINGLAAVDLIDFNGDGKNELVVVYRKSVKVRNTDAQGNYVSSVEDKYYIEIYRYNGNKAILAYKNENISNTLGDSSDMYYIIKKKNGKAYYCVNSFASQEYGRIVNANSTVFKFDGSKFVQQSKASYRTNYGYTDYYIDDTEVYKSTFNEKGYSVPLFDGTSSYDTKTYNVNFLQRKRLKADNLDERVDKTIENIKTLHPSYSGTSE